MACRFPQADDIAAFWRNIRDGRDCIGPIPPERWHPSQVSAGLQGGEPSWRLDAGIVADADSWDAKFFGISDGEARRIDPQQGLVLESAWHACEDANLVPASLTAVRTGVYIGVSTRDFDRRSADDWQGLNVQSASGSCGAVVANRLSYALGLTGPSLAIDTACASSLTAIHMACRALDGDECEMALAGGVQLIMSPTNIVAFSRDRVLAKSGGCKPFSKNADGYVFGEGVGMLLLKPLDAALKDGDHVRAVILGSAVNHNGRSNGLSAPYGAAMQDVMRRALERAGVTPQEVDYVEAHAVGTPIGDAIEVQAVKRVYGANRDAARPCRLGSVKSNIGHLEAASGVASLIKAALALENGMMPASLHCDPPSPALRLDPASMRICDAATAWESEDRPRRAGVSAFGFGGANAHVVLAESPVRPATVAAASTVADPSSVLMLSANDEAAFARLCRSYRKRLAAMKAGNAALCGLRDFCHTAALTRQHHQFRRALQVRGWDDAIAALETALPVRTGKAVCRIGIRTACSDVDDAADAKARRSGYVLGRALAVFGITQVQVDNATAPATAILLADHAARMDLACAIYREEHPPFVDCVILTEAGDPGVRPDLIWREGDTASQQLLELVSMLFEKGFELAADGLAAAIPGNRIQLPLYPFERRRHHALSDTLARAETSALPHVSNLTV
jgi:acyl transferase domain-containing protein